MQSQPDAVVQAPSLATESRDDVLVIGAGVIGLACALALQEAGRRVRVLDAGRPGSGSSHGNCGTLTPSHAPPLAAPGMIGMAMRWMLTPDAPFYIKPRLDPALWRWLLKFASRCNVQQWQQTIGPKSALLQASRQMYPDWIASHGLQCEFSESGTDYVFVSEQSMQRNRADLPMLAELGVQAQVLSGQDYRREEPAVTEAVVGGIRFAGDARLRPDRYVAEMARVLRERGGVIEEDCRVDAVNSDGDAMRVDSRRGPRYARDVLLAAGAWSPLLARRLGLPALPIQPGKGYSITYDRPPMVPRRPLSLIERKVCVTAWDSGFRLGSTMEFAGYDASLNPRRLDALERGAAEYLKQPTGPVKREQWSGWRPLTWDDLPILGRAPGQAHLWLATGHGMMGVGMSPITARLIADMMHGRKPALDLTPYRPERFA